MNTKFVFSVAIVMATAALGAIAVFSSPAISQSLDETATEAQRPLGRINPELPVRIEVVNAGNATVTCVLTQPPSAERVLVPGATTSFGTTTASYLPLPINFLAYPSSTEVGLSSYVSVKGNVVSIVIGQQLSDAPGDIAVSIDSRGYITSF